MSEQIRKQVKYEFCGNIVISFSKWDPLPNVLSNHQLSFFSFFLFFFSSCFTFLFLLFFLSSSLQAWFALSFFFFFLLLFAPTALFLLFFLSSLFLPRLTSSNPSLSSSSLNQNLKVEAFKFLSPLSLFLFFFSLPMAENPSPYCWLFVGFGIRLIKIWGFIKWNFDLGICGFM